jgi:hypothetical protein
LSKEEGVFIIKGVNIAEGMSMLLACAVSSPIDVASVVSLFRLVISRRGRPSRARAGVIESKSMRMKSEA